MRNVVFYICLMAAAAGGAQNNVVYDSRIASLQVMAEDDWEALPIIELNSGDVINIGFDDLSHEYARFTYKLEHCEADWTVSEDMFDSDYMRGFAEGNTIDDYEESFNTNTLYTHYTLSIPNSDCRPTISGNYKLTVFDENNDNKPMFTACFMITEQAASLALSVTTNTDLSINSRHQQVTMELNYGGSLRVVDPETQIKTVLMQNRRWDNSRVNAKPQYKMHDGLKWYHCRDYVFNAGNEYHKYEILDVDHTTMGLESIEWDGEYYHVYPFINEPRKNYLYDEDADGAYCIRNSRNEDSDITCDYVYVTFRVRCPQAVSGRLYVNGAWTNGRFSPEYELTYNAQSDLYEATVMQKQGYYNYQYLLVDKEGNIRTPPFDGNYYQTENKYQALVYFRGQGERTDRLVAYGEVQAKFTR